MASAAVVLAPKKQVKQVLPQNVLRAKVKDEIFAMWFHRLENKYYIGKRLWQLQQLDSKAGSGTFLDDLEELSVPTTTAYRYIAFYKRVCEGFDPTPARMTKAQSAKLLATTEGFPPEKSLELTADEDRAKLAEAIEAALLDVEKAKAEHKERAGGYQIKVIFTETVRTKFKAKYKALGIEKASKIIYEAVINATA